MFCREITLEQHISYGGRARRGKDRFEGDFSKLHWPVTQPSWTGEGLSRIHSGTGIKLGVSGSACNAWKQLLLRYIPPRIDKRRPAARSHRTRYVFAAYRSPWRRSAAQGGVMMAGTCFGDLFAVPIPAARSGPAIMTAAGLFSNL
jgi:hypothetical protein